MAPSIRNPEYTGQNRCLPCTVLNVVIATAVACGVAVMTMQFTSVPVAGGLSGSVFAAQAVVIWLRGYLMPGTPKVTRRHVPRWVLSRFGKPPDTDTTGRSPHPQTIDIEEKLREEGILTLCPDGEDVRLTESFQQSWEAKLKSVGDDSIIEDGLLAAGFTQDDVELSRHEEDAVVVSRLATDVLKWPSSVAIQVDIASSHALAGTVSDWETLAPVDRAGLIRGLRLFLEQCPDGSDVVLEDGTVESCCSPYEVTAIVCVEDGSRVLEQPV